MNGPTLVLLLLAALVLLVLHLAAVMVGQALRAYSLSRLKEVSARRGRPARAQAIHVSDERLERAAEIAAVLSGLLLAALFVYYVAKSPPTHPDGPVIAIAIAFMACAHLAASMLGRVHAESVLDAAWPFTQALRWPLVPVIALIRLIEAAIAHRSRHGRPPRPRPASVEVEIHARATDEDESSLEAELTDATRQRLEHVIALEDRPVLEIMTPRLDVIALPASVSAPEAARGFLTSGLSRIPLYGENRDDIIGILYAKDLLASLVEPSESARNSPRKLARPPLFVPESKSASELIDELRQRRVQIAVVLDEFGAVSGIITLEDLLEEIVGSIHDEHDPISSDEEFIRQIDDGRYEVDAAITLDEINERLGLNLPVPSEGDYHTVGGLALDALGRVPDEGATFRVAGVKFTVLQVVDHAIRRLDLDVRPPVESHAHV